MASYTVLPESLVVGAKDKNGVSKRFVVSKTDYRYDKVLELIRAKNGEEISDEEMIAACDPSVGFEEEGVKLDGGVVYINDEAMPAELSARMIAMKKEKIPVIQLVNFWKNLQQNPSMNSVTQLYKFLEHNGHPITSDGCFIAYRSVREDWKDFHTGTMDNSVGKTLSMPRNKVDDKPDQTCSHGLHVASWSYASGFGGSDRRLVEVKVNPKDVVCVPTDYNNTKMRVCEFTVIGEVDRPSNTAFRQEDMDEGEDFDDSYDEEDEKGYSLSEEAEVLAARDDFENDYSGDGLVARIAEFTGFDSDLVETILNDN